MNMPVDVHFFNPYLYRSEFNATTEEEECQRALAHLRRMIECEGPNSVAAILLESVPGTAGILVPPKVICRACARWQMSSALC
jgi:taurine--2-oxoglutarate transaminase